MITRIGRRALLAVAALCALGATSCEMLFGPSGPEAKYQEALQSVNPAWSVYEVTNEGQSVVIRVEVDETVPFDQGKKAGEAIQAIEPQFSGYVEFFNSEVGMVLRKLEIFPAT
ncbi:MAG: hypothetical protein HQK87_03095 [Nitrospinae bacterium]|nr:hypothetical protein [Nitrospinota bacterium]